MNDLFSQALVERLGWTLVHFLWQGLLVAALLAAGLFLLRNARPNRRYLAGCLALIVLATAPAITFHFVAGQSPPPAISGIELKSSPSIPAESISKPIVEGEVQVVHRHLGGELNFSQRLEMFFPWMVMAWILGVMLFSCRLLGGWLQIRRLRRTAEMMIDEVWRERLTRLSQRLGVDQPVRLLHSAWVEVPTVMGWLRPVILLPAGCLMGLSPAQLESILAHELAHIQRHDYLVNLLQSVVETILFYHPAVWWVSRRVREERENCCDDLAVEVCGDRAVYARALATLEELRTPAPLALAAAGPTLLSRIRRLAGQSAKNADRPAWPLAGIIVLMMIGALGIGLRGNRALAQENESKATNTPLHTGPHQANQIYTGIGRQEIFSKLDRIRIDSIKFDHAPLTEVVNYLSEISMARDPDRRGINYFIDLQASRRSAIDPNTGLPVAAPLQDADLRGVSVTIEPPLSNLKLKDVLDLVIRSADRPVGYSVLDYGVVFRLKGPNEEPLEIRTFHVDPNTFQQGLEGVMGVPFGTVSGSSANGGGVGTGAMVPQVNVTSGISGVTSSRAVQGGAGQGPSAANDGKNSAASFQEIMRKFFTAAGVDLGTNNAANVGKMFVWNSRKGILMVRSTSNDLDKIEAAIGKMMKPEQGSPNRTNAIPTKTKNEIKTNTTVNIKVQFAAIGDSHLVSSGKDGFAAVLPGLAVMDEAIAVTSPSVLVESVPGAPNALNNEVYPSLPWKNTILTSKQYQEAISWLERRDSVNILTYPSVTTESGRSAQIQASEIRKIITGLNSPRDGDGKVEDEIQTPGGSSGPTLDIVPQVLPASNDIALKVSYNFLEFIGYDGPRYASPPAFSKEGPPAPHFRPRQMNCDVMLQEGQTLVLGAVEAERLTKVKDKVPMLGDLPLVGRLFTSTSSIKTRKDLLIFVTPTLINSDGTPVHSVMKQ